MADRFIYLDNAATTAVNPEVFDFMAPFFVNKFGNPSTLYSIGRDSKKHVEESRDKVAFALGAESSEIVFTGSGTEGDNFAIKGIAYANKGNGNHIITTNIEHYAVLNTCKALEKEGYVVTYLPVDENGKVTPEQVVNAIRKDTILVSIMFANNEIGTIQDIKNIAAAVKEKGVYFHTDAVQAVGAIPVNVKELNVDLLTLSGHKIGGPKGIGVLYIKKGTKISSILQGGSQERGKRPGTENVPGIVGIGKALEITASNLEKKIKYVTDLREHLIGQVLKRIPYTRLNGHRNDRLPGNANFSFEFIEGESLLLMLDMKGVAASSGSACASGSLDPSHVLLAIGLPHEIAHGSLRLTISHENTMEEINYVVDILEPIVSKLREMSPLYEKVKREV